MPRNKTADAIGWCEFCQKLSYSTRKAAARTAKQLHGSHVGAYPCRDPQVFFPTWHMGTLADDVRHGHVTRDDYYGRGEAP